MTPYLAPGCPEELLITRNTLREVRQKGQAGARGESQPWQPCRERWHCPAPHDLGRTGSVQGPCQPLHLGTTQPGSDAGAGAGREAPARAEGPERAAALRIRGHLCILWHWAGLTVAKQFPADICPIYFQNPPTVTPGNLFLCFPTQS